MGISVIKKKPWDIRDLVIVGLIAALARALGLISVFALGGMNPISLTVRAMIVAILYIVLLHKVRRFGALTLAILIGALTSFLIMAIGIVTLPILLLGGLAAESFISLAGRERTISIVAGVFLMTLVERAAGLFVVYLNMRESVGMIWPFLIMSVPGLCGTALGCFYAPLFIKELKRACFING
ncbi:MAG: MptD family putative ECF transporter S component [Deltaproteobacteria bacterium]|jgi:energy-coupling factor transport system substrate-specific component|nr:MptD family putative ECF transporter S component [Deltaproteobacteria bacterium]